jgi:hypothetical protein
MDALVTLLWVRLPAAARRVSFTLALLLADGAYLRAWPPLGAGVPVAGAGLGVLVALALRVFDVGPLYTYSFLGVALLLLVGGLGAGAGVWTWLGFTLTDLVIGDRAALPGFRPYYGGGPEYVLTRGWVPLLVAYLLLFGLVAFVPLVSHAFALRSEVAVGRAQADLAPLAGGLTYVVVLAAFTYGWAQAVPFLVRPVWSFAGLVPDIAAVQPIQSHTVGLGAVAGLTGAARAVLTVMARPRLRRLPVAPALVAPGRGVPSTGRRLAGAAAQAAVLTLLLSGLLANVAVALVFLALIFGTLVLRTVVVPALPVWPDLVRRVPVLLRVAACALVAYAMTSVVVEPAVRAGERSFTSLVIAVLASLLLSVFLLPGPPPRRSAAERVGGPPPAPPHPSPPAPPVPPPPAPPAPGAPPPRWGRLRLPVAAATALVAGLAGALIPATPAFADNCSGLSDCSFGVKVALVAGAIALVLLAVVLLPELLGGAAVIEGGELLGAAAEAGFTAEEAGIIAEANGILESAELAQVAEAHAAGESLTVEIGGRLIQYEPGLPASGMTMFGENGFLIGNEAFASEGELAKTVLHELYRLGTSVAPESGVTASTAAAETEAAFNFATRAFEFLKGLVP